MTLTKECWLAIEKRAEAAFKSDDPEKALAELRRTNFVKSNAKICEAIIAAVRDDVVRGIKEMPPVYGQNAYIL